MSGVRLTLFLLTAGQIFNGQMSGILPTMWKNAHCMLFCYAATFKNVIQTLIENLMYITNLARTLIFNSGVPDTKGAVKHHSKWSL